MSTVPAGSPSLLAFSEPIASEIVDENGDGTCHANTQHIAARCDHKSIPDTGSRADRQKSRDSSRACRWFVWLLFHTICSFDV